MTGDPLWRTVCFPGAIVGTPLLIGFVEVGIPLGATLSFLISAPMVSEVALVLPFGRLGWKVAALYLVGIAVGAGIHGYVPAGPDP